MLYIFNINNHTIKNKLLSQQLEYECILSFFYSICMNGTYQVLILKISVPVPRSRLKFILLFFIFFYYYIFYYFFVVVLFVWFVVVILFTL